MTLGGYLLWVALLFEIFTLASYLFGLKEWTRYAYVTMTLFLTIPTILLFYHLLSRDFAVSYVTAYTSRSLSTLYTISAFWAGQEGSFLLWAFLSAVVGLFLLRLTWEWQRPVMVIYNLVNLSLIILLIKQSPFHLLANVPVDGHGLNPLLLNPWMAIHPPIMFLGYAAYGIPFAFVLAALWKRDLTHWAQVSQRWLLFAWVSLGLGIILGGYWSYETLGWGGYWGWDPVENASLVPWIFGTALLHGVALQRRFNAFYKSNILLAIASFFFIIYGTFLTRSGILADFSVHSFVDLGITGWLILILLFFLVLSLVLFVLRIKSIPKGDAIQGMLSPPSLLASSIVLLVLSAVMITLGTSSPLITRLWNAPSQVGIPFYVTTQIPIAALLLITFSLFVWKKLWGPLSLLLALAAIGISYAYGVHNPLHLLLVGLSVATIMTQFIRPQRLSIALIHAGVAFLILGSIFATGYERLHKVTLTQNKPVTVEGRTLTFQEFKPPAPGEKTAVFIELKRGKRVKTVTPKLWFNEKTNQVVANPYIDRHILYDDYFAAHDYTPPSTGRTITMKKGEKRHIDDLPITFKGFKIKGEHTMGKGMTVQAILDVGEKNPETIHLDYILVSPSQVERPEALLPGTNVSVRLAKIEASSGRIYLEILSSGGTAAKALVEFSIIPLISLVWLGCLLMVIGGLWGLLPARKAEGQ